MVANKIYATAHDGLTQLVSARVASQILDSALRSVGCSAETVTAKKMRHLLRGPVMRELAPILPRAGLELSLKKLLKTLKTFPDEALEAEQLEVEQNAEVPAGDTVAAEMGSATAAPDIDISGPDPAVSDPAVSDPAASDSTTPNPPTPDAAPSDFAAGETFMAEALVDGPLVVAEASVAATDDMQVLVAAARAQPKPPTLEPAARDDLLLAFAQLEHVQMVAAFEGGGVTSVRGQGFEVEALSRLGTLGLKLLGRSGELRTFYVAHSRGQLFLFPFGTVALMLIGGSELNLGLVFATLHKFKEEL